MKSAVRSPIRVLLAGAAIAGGGYIALCAYLYATEGARLFRPAPLPADYSFSFGHPFEEHNISARPGAVVNTVLLPAPANGGVVFLLGGNSSNVTETVPRFIQPIADAGWDLFVADYPGFGKSTGGLQGEADLDAAALTAYDWLRRLFPEDRIVVAGYSLGSAPAAWLACRHHPQRLVLIAPFFSGADIVRADHPYLPQQWLRYPMRNDLELPRCEIPVTIFHGAADDVIPPSDSERLRALLKPADTLTVIPGAGHLDLPNNPEYQQAMRKLLEDAVRPLAAAPKGVRIR